jgi:Leucine-rich repeat (LRR) protein
MRKLFLSLLFLSFVNKMDAQSYKCFDDRYRAGQSAFKTGDFRSALNSFYAAKDCVPVRLNSDIDRWIRNTSDSLAAMTQTLQRQKSEIELEKNRVDSLRILANSIIDAFYFYEDSLALAFKGNKYGFINKKGNVIIPYNYTSAQQFNWRGYALVSKQNADYLINTKGEEFRFSDKIPGIGKEVEAIDLSKYGLKEIPTVVDACADLKLLFLNNNSIKYIKPSLYSLNRIEYIDFSFNDFEYLSDSLSLLKNLAHLDVRNNRISRIGQNFEVLKSLRYLNISGNQLTELPESIFRLQGLENLNASNNDVSRLNLGEIASSSIKNLDLSRNNLENISENIGLLEKLEYLNLSENKITELPLTLSKLKNLKKLNLSSTNIEMRKLLAIYENYSGKIIITNVEDENNDEPGTLLIILPQNYIITPDLAILKSAAALNPFFINLKELPNEIFDLNNIPTSTWERYGDQFFQLKKFETAAKCYEKVLQKTESPILFVRTGDCYRNLKNYDKGILYYEKAIKINTKNIDDNAYPRMRAAQLYHEKNQYKKTVDIFKSLTKDFPDTFLYHFQLGYHALFTGEYVLAINSSTKSLELNASRTGAYSNLALAYVLNGKFQLAEPIYREWKDKDFVKGRPAKDVFINDITDLRTRGIDHPDFNKVIELLEAPRRD